RLRGEDGGGGARDLRRLPQEGPPLLRRQLASGVEELQLLAVGRPEEVLPEQRGPIAAGGDDAQAVRAEPRAPHRAGVAGERGQGPARGRLPNPRRAVAAGGDDALAVRIEDRALHRGGVAG